MYYLRSKPAVNPVKFSIKKKVVEKVTEANDDSSSVKSEESLGFFRKNSATRNALPDDKENRIYMPAVPARRVLGIKQEISSEEPEETCTMCSS